jgi:hypothetical protein
MDKIPLDPDVQNDLKAYNTGRIEYKRGFRCEVWDFNLKLNDKYSADGIAWLNTQGGEAVSFEYSLEPSFPFVEEIIITLNYITDSAGRWYMEEMRFTGKANIIIMKKSFDALTSFSDYR